jgi:hypothetical protein
LFVGIEATGIMFSLWHRTHITGKTRAPSTDNLMGVWTRAGLQAPGSRPGPRRIYRIRAKTGAMLSLIRTAGSYRGRAQFIAVLVIVD